jgi:hypothetical protein
MGNHNQRLGNSPLRQMIMLCQPDIPLSILAKKTNRINQQFFRVRKSMQSGQYWDARFK